MKAPVTPARLYPRGGFARGFKEHSDGAPEAASNESSKVTPSGAPFGGFCLRLRSLCDDGVRGNGGAPLRRRGHARPQTYDAAATTAGRHRLPLRRATGKHPPDARGASVHLCATQARPVKALSKRRSDAPRLSLSGGRPFSADPVREVLRPSFMPRADPASPQRLAVYPRAGWEDCRRGFSARGFRADFS